MIILEKFQLFQKIVGLDPHGGLISSIVKMIYLFVFIPFIVMELIVFISNVRGGMGLALNAMSALCGVLPPMLSYGHLLINRKRYFSVLREMQSIVNESA